MDGRRGQRRRLRRRRAGSRLGCVPALRKELDDVLRKELDDVLRRMHYIAVRDRRVANSIAADAVHSSDLGAVCNFVFQQA